MNLPGPLPNQKQRPPRFQTVKPESAAQPYKSQVRPQCKSTVITPGNSHTVSVYMPTPIALFANLENSAALSEQAGDTSPSSLACSEHIDPQTPSAASKEDSEALSASKVPTCRRPNGSLASRASFVWRAETRRDAR